MFYLLETYYQYLNKIKSTWLLHPTKSVKALKANVKALKANYHTVILSNYHTLWQFTQLKIQNKKTQFLNTFIRTLSYTIILGNFVTTNRTSAPKHRTRQLWLYSKIIYGTGHWYLNIMSNKLQYCKSIIDNWLIEPVIDYDMLKSITEIHSVHRPTC